MEKLKVTEKKRHKGEGGKTTLVVSPDKRTTTSKYNALKHGRYAKLPMYCDDCYYRSVEAGGNGKCKAYEAESLCGIRADIRKHCDAIDSRKPEALKKITDEMIHVLMERVLFAAFQANMDGNLVDKATNAQLHSLHQYIKLMKELEGTVKITATQAEGVDDADEITKLFQQISVEKK